MSQVRMDGYNQQTQAPEANGEPRAHGEQFLNGFSALSNVGQALGEVGGALQQKVNYQNELDAQAAANKDSSSAHLYWLQYMQDKKLNTSAADIANPPQGSKGFTPDVIEQFDKYSSDMLEKATTPKAREYLQQHLDALRTQVASDSIRFEGAQKVNYRAEQYQDSIDNWSKVVLQDPAKFDLAYSQLSGNVPADIGPDAQEKLKDNVRSNLIQGAANGAITKNPSSSLAILDKALKQSDGNSPGKTGVGWVDKMSVPELLHYHQEAQNEVNRQTEKLKVGLADKEQDLAAMASNSVAPPPGFIPANLKQTYIAAFGAEQGAKRYQQNIADVADLANTTSQFAALSPQDRIAKINEFSPQAGDGFAHDERMYRVALQANDNIERQIKADPASFILKTSPMVQGAQKVLADAFTQPMQQVVADDGKPKFVPTAEQQKATDNYAQAMLAEQSRQGVDNPKLLNGPTVARIVSQFYDQQNGGANPAAVVSSLESQWGKSWPLVFRQLSEDGKLPPAALVIPNMSDDGAKERLARWSMVDDKVFKERIDPGDAKNVEDYLRKGMAPFWNTLSLQNGGENTFKVYQSQAQKLALGYVSEGKSPGDAVDQAIKETYGHHYDFTDTYRVPKSEQPDVVESGAKLFSNRPDLLNIAPFPNQVGMDEKQSLDQTLKIIKHNSVWVTNNDETGLKLYVNGNSGPVPVLSKSGKQIDLTWKQLRDSGNESNAARQAQPLVAPSGVMISP